MSVEATQAPRPPAPSPAKSPGAFRTITEVAGELDLPQHVLRFWETKFPQIRPMKRRGGRRYYRPEDVVLLREIRRLLYVDGYTIRGVQKVLRQRGRGALARPLAAAGVAGNGAATGDGNAETAVAATANAQRESEVGPDEDVSPSAPIAAPWRRDMMMSTVLREELFGLLCALEELRALLPGESTTRPE